MSMNRASDDYRRRHTIRFGPDRVLLRVHHDARFSQWFVASVRQVRRAILTSQQREDVLAEVIQGESRFLPSYHALRQQSLGVLTAGVRHQEVFRGPDQC